MSQLAMVRLLLSCLMWSIVDMHKAACTSLGCSKPPDGGRFPLRRYNAMSDEQFAALPFPAAKVGPTVWPASFIHLSSCKCGMLQALGEHV